MSNWIRCLAILMIGSLGGTLLAAQSDKERNEHWVATWATAQELSLTVQEIPELPPGVSMPDFSKLKGPVMPLRIPKSVQDETVRMIVRTSIGGNKLRIELSNAFGLGIVTIGDADLTILNVGIFRRSRKQSQNYIQRQPGCRDPAGRRHCQ